MTNHEREVDVTHALEAVGVPAAVIARNGRIRWLNRGARGLVGDRVGQPFAAAVAPESLHAARMRFARKVIGENGSTDCTLTLLGCSGSRLAVRVSVVPFWEDGEIAGVFVVAYPSRPEDSATTRPTAAADAPELTARQYEALALLADGLGTNAIATQLGIAEETVRNHVRGLFRQLEVHSRLEAVVRAYRLGLLQPRVVD
jgi:DNA-binding CsgD family transcriptional regulator